MSKDAIDWAAAVRSGQRRVRRGPTVTAAEAASVVSDLRVFARDAELRVRETTGLGLDLPVAEADVVDRRGWIAAAAAGMAELTKPLTDALVPADYRGPSAGGQIGLMLAYMSSRILGQYDPVGGVPISGGQRTETGSNAGLNTASTGRLLLVAPNIVKVEREIDAVPADFRLWVCLHESTHRLQFSAVGWMTGYFRQLIADYAAVAPTDSGEFLRHVVQVVTGRDKGPDDATHGTTDGGTGDENGGLVATLPRGSTWLQRIQTPEQQKVFDQLMALMTLLEGHADFVMDAVGPAVVPTVDDIRTAFTERRAKRRGPVDRLVRSLMGMDAKMAQYARGAAFVRGVVDRVGMTEFNAVFSSAETLPTMVEIIDPAAWVLRVHG
ncbi:MAG: zinc-dependent metalloprotease [Nakamurella sp.]